jgi:glucose/arabinose dehydrogenase
MVWARDGKLFVTLGERSILPGRVQAQRLDSHFGKIVRINPDGSVPRTIRSSGAPGAQARNLVLGHRNILSAALDARGRLWEVEMGPRGGDELNRPERARIMAGRRSAMARNIRARRSTRRPEPRAWSSRFIIGIR